MHDSIGEIELATHPASASTAARDTLVPGAVAVAHGLSGARATLASSAHSHWRVYLDGDRLRAPGEPARGEGLAGQSQGDGPAVQ